MVFTLATCAVAAFAVGCGSTAAAPTSTTAPGQQAASIAQPTLAFRWPAGLCMAVTRQLEQDGVLVETATKSYDSCVHAEGEQLRITHNNLRLAGAPGASQSDLEALTGTIPQLLIARHGAASTQAHGLWKLSRTIGQ